MPGRLASPPATPRTSRPWTSVPVGVAGARVHDEAGRLVDDEEVLVLVGDPEVERLLLQRPLGDRGSCRARAPPRPASRWLFGRVRPVDEHGAGGEQALGRRSRADLGQLREEAVEPRRRPPS